MYATSAFNGGPDFQAGLSGHNKYGSGFGVLGWNRKLVKQFKQVNYLSLLGASRHTLTHKIHLRMVLAQGFEPCFVRFVVKVPGFGKVLFGFV